LKAPSWENPSGEQSEVMANSWIRYFSLNTD
jgi:hypothetical protein